MTTPIVPATTQLTPPYVDRVMLVNPQSNKKISDWLQDVYRMVLSPEELERYLAVFLSDPVNEQELVEILVFQRINFIKRGLLALVNEIYPQVENYIGKSKEDLFEKLVRAVISPAERLIAEEAQVVAEILANFQPEFRVKFLEDMYRFFDTYEYSPLKERFENFMIIRLSLQTPPASKSKLQDIPEKLSRCLQGSLKETVLPIFENVANVCAEELREAQAAVNTAERAMREDMAKFPSLRELARITLDEARIASDKAQSRYRELKLQLERATADPSKDFLQVIICII